MKPWIQGMDMKQCPLIHVQCQYIVFAESADDEEVSDTPSTCGAVTGELRPDLPHHVSLGRRQRLPLPVMPDPLLLDVRLNESRLEQQFAAHREARGRRRWIQLKSSAPQTRPVFVVHRRAKQ
jgi:hypothetical protein